MFGTNLLSLLWVWLLCSRQVLSPGPSYHSLPPSFVISAHFQVNNNRSNQIIFTPPPKTLELWRQTLFDWSAKLRCPTTIPAKIFAKMFSEWLIFVIFALCEGSAQSAAVCLPLGHKIGADRINSNKNHTYSSF